MVDTSSDIERHILDNTVDLGLIETSPESPDIVYEPFQKDSLCAIAPVRHPLTRESSVSLSMLAEYPFLMREKGSAGRELLDASFSLLQLTVRPVWESASTRAIVSAVSEGLGVAVLPESLVEKDIREGSVKKLPLDPPIHRELNIIYHKSKYLTPNLLFFLGLCRAYGQEPGSS